MPERTQENLDATLISAGITDEEVRWLIQAEFAEREKANPPEEIDWQQILLYGIGIAGAAVGVPVGINTIKKRKATPNA